jgi:hypothetical protein
MSNRDTPTPEVYSFIAMISLPDIGEEKLGLEELVEMAKQFNRQAGMAFLVRLNLYLSLTRPYEDPIEAIQVQQKLTRKVLSPTRLQQIERVFMNRGLHQKWILLHRAQLLVGVKLIALYGRAEGGNCLETEHDQTAIREFALAINACYGPGLDEPNRPIGDVIAQLAASVEFQNLPLLVYGLVRTRTLLGSIFRDYLAGIAKENWPPPFERIFTLLNGINFRDFLDIMLYMHLEHSTMLKEVLGSDKMPYVNTARPKRYVSGQSMKAWAELMSVAPENIKDLVQGTERDPAFFFDFTMFRRFPLWRVDAHRYFCIDGMFLEERLSSAGFYWVVINGLVDDGLRGRFQQLWGELIQEYVRRLMGRFCADSNETLVRKPTYDDDSTEVFDTAAISGKCLVAIEVKSSVIPIDQKYAGQAAPFFQGVSAKFGNAPSAAVEQLLRNIEHIFSSVRPREVQSLPVAEIQEILPVAVVHEPILRFGAAAQTVVNEFKNGLSKLKIRKDVQIRNVQLIEIEDLERLEPYLQNHDFTLTDCLRAKVQADPAHRMGLWDFVRTHYVRNRGLESKTTTRLAGVFSWLTASALWRVYRGDYFDPNLGTRERTGRAYICARPVGGDGILSDEVNVLSEHRDAAEAYQAIEELQANGVPHQRISADAFVCGVVDEFGVLLDRPSAREQ